MSSIEPNADAFINEIASADATSTTTNSTNTVHTASNGIQSKLEPGVQVQDLTDQTLRLNGSNLDHEENQYLDLIRDILRHGEFRPDRTGTGTISIFNPATLRFTLSRPDKASDTGYINVLPLLTTKRVFTKAVIAELLWFIKGSTNAKELSDQGVHIWDGNGSREFLDKLGPPQSLREEGDLGPVYGFQWRHFGAEYKDCHADYTGQGVDQIKEIAHKLKNNPYDRRILLSAWNVGALSSMALPLCHLLAQFYVSFPDAPKGEEAYKNWLQHAKPSASKGRLSCTLYQRSADIGLGVPFNIASYALLTHMLAFACNLIPGTFNMVLGDAHIYVDHIDALKQQIERTPRDFPGLKINRADAGQQNIDGWKFEDFEILNYKPHASVKMKMSV